MQKEPIALLNLPRRGKISGVQNVTLYCKIDTVILFFRWLYIWSLAQGLYKTLDPLFLYQKNLRYEALKNRIVVLGLFWQISNAHCCALVPITLKKQHCDKKQKNVLSNLEWSFFEFFSWKWQKSIKYLTFYPSNPHFTHLGYDFSKILS